MSAQIIDMFEVYKRSLQRTKSERSATCAAACAGVDTIAEIRSAIRAGAPLDVEAEIKRLHAAEDDLAHWMRDESCAGRAFVTCLREIDRAEELVDVLARYPEALRPLAEVIPLPKRRRARRAAAR